MISAMLQDTIVLVPTLRPLLVLGELSGRRTY